MSWILLITVCLYAILIGEFAVAHWRLPEYVPRKQSHLTHFSIIIPYRNEAENLPRLLQAIAQLDYPFDRFEVFLINDASSDRSLEIIQSFMQSHPHLPISCLDNVCTSGSPKKDALALGIKHSQYDWIITTDADCTFPASWLPTIHSFILEKKPKMIAGPVTIATHSQSSFLHAFEQLDILSLMGATIGGFAMRMPFLCNGAHLVYEKNAFLEQGGFDTNNHIASGDDHFLLEKFVKAYPRKVHYLKTSQAIVTTQAQESWKALISQRVRWVSKASAYSYWFSKGVGLLVFLVNLITAVLIIYIPFQWIGVDEGASAWAKLPSRQAGALLEKLLMALLFKWIVDYILIARTAQFFKRKRYLLWYPLVMLVYPFITVYIALRSTISSYEWKGRQFLK